jgi:hypothetical protein
MGFFNRESEEDKIAKIRKLREEAKEVTAKYNAVQKRKALDRTYAKEKAQVDKRKFEASKFGQLVSKAQEIGGKAADMTQKVANSKLLQKRPVTKGQKPYKQYDFAFGNAPKNHSTHDPIFGNAPKKKKGKTYDPIFG